jgi:hypothetical protein
LSALAADEPVHLGMNPDAGNRAGPVMSRNGACLEYLPADISQGVKVRGIGFQDMNQIESQVMI